VPPSLALTICGGRSSALPISVQRIFRARIFYLLTSGRVTTGHAARPTALYRETTASSSPWHCSPS